MRALLFRWLGNAAVLVLLSMWEGSGVHVETASAALLAVVLWSLLNALLKPFIALLKIATCLVHLLTLGLSTLLIAFILNLLLFAVIGYLRWVPGFWVDTPEAGLRAALILSLAGFVFNRWVRDEDEDRRRK